MFFVLLFKMCTPFKWGGPYYQKTSNPLIRHIKALKGGGSMQPISPFFKKGPPILGFWGSGAPFFKKGGACNPLKGARLIKAPIQKIKREYGGG